MENLLSGIEDLSKSKGINPQIVIDAIKDAIVVAARKYYKTHEDLVAELDPGSGQVQVFAVLTVSDLVSSPAKEISLEEAREVDPNVQVGDLMRFAKPTEGLGRISAQLAKQVIFQKIREAERETIYNEFSGRLNDIVPATVKRSEGPDLIVDLGRTEARLPRREQSRLESFSPGDRIRVVIKAIEKAGRGPAVIVSRASEELVKTLFEQEVPEIYDGTVKIRACAREAGERTKIAVQSSDRDVDAVGACVGMKGMRVQSIIRELRGEKIDIIEYSEEPIDLATRALSPAKISRATILDAAGKHLEVVVDDTQLSLAIGKKGQNVRLAAKMMGWRIDIKSEEEKRQEVESAMAAMVGSGTPVSVLMEHGLGEKLVDKLLEAGTSTVERLADMTPEQLAEIPGVGPKITEKIQLAVNSYYSQFEEGQAQPEYGEGPESEPPPEETSAEPPPEAPAAAAPSPAEAAPVMPGLPVEGEEQDGELDEGLSPDEEETWGDFDTINQSNHSTSASEDTADISEVPPGNEDGVEPQSEANHSNSDQESGEEKSHETVKRED